VGSSRFGTQSSSHQVVSDKFSCPPPVLETYLPFPDQSPATSNDTSTCRIFPTAPTRPISVNMQMSMPGWFDIDHLDVGAFQGMMRGQRQGFDPDGVAESVEYVKTLVQKEIANGIPASRIVVGGFSQGGHIALKTALPAKDRLAGCLALSTWMEAAQMDIPPVNLDMPIFMGHGSSDPLIPLLVANATLDVLQKTKGCRNVDFNVYPGMQHSACPQEFQDVRKFLLKVLPEQEASAPSKEDVATMSAKQLKDFLASRGVSAAGLLEKRELVEKALSLL
jgi:lysophospholipase I